MTNRKKYHYCNDFRPYLSNPRKYKSEKALVQRSGLERFWFLKIDTNPNITEFYSESFFIPYLKPNFLGESVEVQYKDTHRYFVDLLLIYKLKNGGTVQVLCEIKPLQHSLPPIEPKRKTKKSVKNYHLAIQNYLVNMAKWQFTLDKVNEINKKQDIKFEFKIFTESKVFDAKIFLDKFKESEFYKLL